MSETTQELVVYLVTIGCYSDYHVDSVFRRRADAEVYASWVYGEVEEYVCEERLAPQFVQKRCVDSRLYRVRLDQQGNQQVELSALQRLLENPSKRIDGGMLTPAEHGIRAINRPLFVAYVWASNSVGAVKQTRDYLQSGIAAGRWAWD